MGFRFIRRSGNYLYTYLLGKSNAMLHGIWHFMDAKAETDHSLWLGLK